MGDFDLVKSSCIHALIFFQEEVHPDHTHIRDTLDLLDIDARATKSVNSAIGIININNSIISIYMYGTHLNFFPYRGKFILLKTARISSCSSGGKLASLRHISFFENGSGALRRSLKLLSISKAQPASIPLIAVSRISPPANFTRRSRAPY